MPHEALASELENANPKGDRNDQRHETGTYSIVRHRRFLHGFLRAVLGFAKHDDAVDFSKTARRIVDSVGGKVSLWIDDRHTLSVEIEVEGEAAEMTSVEEELAERIRIAYTVLSSTPKID